MPRSQIAVRKFEFLQLVIERSLETPNIDAKGKYIDKIYKSTSKFV